jgi:hypothetical protein
MWISISENLRFNFITFIQFGDIEDCISSAEMLLFKTCSKMAIVLSRIAPRAKLFHPLFETNVFVYCLYTDTFLLLFLLLGIEPITKGLG